MRVYTASLGTETNTFAPIPTGYQTFIDTFVFEPGQHPTDMPTPFTGPLWAARLRAKEKNWEVIEGFCAFAQPAGITVRKVYEDYRDRILDGLKKAMPVDMVVIGMHGAMVADGYDDCEGDLMARIRAIVGPKVPIGLELDPHCHVTQQMIDNATAIICFKEYPHTDYVERGLELVDICADAAIGKTKPVMSLHDCKMISMFHTPREPMRGFVDGMSALEGKNGVLSVSLAHGFPWGDVADMGTKVLVVTDGKKAEGDRLAKELGRKLWGLREQVRPESLTNEAGLDKAMTIDGTVVLADSPDNAGGGAPSDSTYLLETILARGIKDVALGPIWDPVAVRFCFEAGEGAKLRLRVGGKVCEYSGKPLDLDVTVTKLVKDATQATFGPARGPMGDSAAIRTGNGVDIVLTSIRGQAIGEDMFTGL
ncbi:MAG: M81 family metallopeptidase, partial [Alphaproteobacteria bacterium]|nr:M81 family metallopeptidase [Alphaproteobacteria bacterium]